MRRAKRHFLCMKPDVFVRWSHIPLSYVGVPSAIQQGALRPKAGGVMLSNDFSNTPTAMFPWRLFYALGKFWEMRFLLALLFIVIVIAPARAENTCDAGYYLNEVGECEICPAGYYCPGDNNKNECRPYFAEAIKHADTTGLTSEENCEYLVTPGYYVLCDSDRHLLAYQCGQVNPGTNEYCPGFRFTQNNGLNCGSVGFQNGIESCPDGTYVNAEIGATGCNACPPDDTVYADSCDISYGEAECEPVGGTGGGSVEKCKMSGIQRAFANDTGIVVVLSVFDENGTVSKIVAGGYALSDPAGSLINVMIYGTGIVFSSVTDAKDGVCVPSDTIESNIPDGTICGDLYGDGSVQCMTCADGFGSPLFTHSDGTRSQITDCYAISNPGYYIQTNMDTYEVYESECVPGDYCPGGIDVRYDMATDSIFGGNISCATLGDEYTMSDAGADVAEKCYATCNGEFLYWPNQCGGATQCASGYELINNACYAVCNSGISHMHTSVGNSFTLFAERVTSPSLNISYNNTVCYVPLSPGQSKNTININYNGQIYHLEQ